MAILLLASLVPSQYNRAELVDILDVLDNPVFLHVLDKTLLLSLLIPLTDRGCTRRLCNRCIFNLETAGRISVQHLNSAKATKFLLAQLARGPLCCPCTVLVDHTLNEIGC